MDTVINEDESISEKKILRSLIKKYFPIDCLVKLDQLTTAHWIKNNNLKSPKIREILDEYNVPYSGLGTGTNRYGVLIDGYAVKIALDRAGKTDNKREFKYSKIIYPDVVKVYECLESGLVAVFEYVSYFSLDDFYDHQEEMREILYRISQEFLIGDMGVTTENFMNWGIRSDGSIAILDFAYIYALSYRGFVCTCDDEGTLEFDNDYNYLVCPFCRRKWSFEDIRKRITKADEIAEIGDIKELGYVLTTSEEEHEIDYSKTPRKEIKEKKKPTKRNHEEEPKQNHIPTAEEQKAILQQINDNIESEVKTRHGKKQVQR